MLNAFLILHLNICFEMVLFHREKILVNNFTEKLDLYLYFYFPF